MFFFLFCLVSKSLLARRKSMEKYGHSHQNESSANCCKCFAPCMCASSSAGLVCLSEHNSRTSQQFRGPTKMAVLELIFFHRQSWPFWLDALEYRPITAAKSMTNFLPHLQFFAVFGYIFILRFVFISRLNFYQTTNTTKIHFTTHFMLVIRANACLFVYLPHNKQKMSVLFV